MNTLFIHIQRIVTVKLSCYIVLLIYVMLQCSDVNVYAETDTTSKQQIHDARIGFDAFYILPILSISNYMHNSYSADIFANSNIPSVKKLFGIDMRSGFMCTAFMLHSTSLTFKSSISIIKAFQTNEIGYAITQRFRPFVHFGFGISQVTLIDESNNSINQSIASNKLSIIIGLGTDYRILNSERAFMYVKLDYIKIFQNVDGDFLKASVGLAYTCFYW
ncbi:MAG: hypothetical protein ACUVRK_05045 [Spirochaetota bacterium]